MPRRKKYKISKKKVRRFIVIVILVVLAIIVTNIIRINNKLNEDKPIEEAKLSSETDDFKEFIQENGIQINSNEKLEDDTLYVNLSFKNNLYDNGKVQEEYFANIIKEFNKSISNDYILYDKSKNIEIIVKRTDESNYTYTINGRENYFDNENLKILEENSKIEEKDYTTKSSAVRVLDGFNWSILDAPQYTLQEDGTYLGENKLRLETKRNNIIRVVVDEEYNGEILDGVKVGTDLEKIEKKLGEPTFEDSQLNMIAYKIKDTYVFFYEDKAVICPNIEYKNKDLEKLIFSYYEGEYEKERARFANEILNTFSDFESYLVNDTLILRSVTRQIELIIPKNEKMEIKLYNNYNFTSKMMDYIMDNKITLNLSEDYLYKSEVEYQKNK